MVGKFGLGLLLSLAAVAASAVPVVGDRLCRVDYIFHVIPHEVCETPKFAQRTVPAPEIDPASAVAGLTLLFGGLAVLRGRRA